MGESAGNLKVRTPWALFGEELDGWGKLDATNRQFVHGLFKRNLGANQIQGVWHVAINDPDIDPDVLPILKNGSTWIAQTVDPTIPESAPIALPGIGGKFIHNGELIVWSEIDLEYKAINISPLNATQANARYVELAGDVMTGELHLYGDPTVPLGAAPKQYIDDNFLPLTGGTLTGALKLPVIDLYDPYVGLNPWWSIAVGGGAGLLPDFALIRYDQNGIPRGAPILINNTDPVVQGNAVINLNATVILDRDPTQDMQAATKIYVDKGVSGAQQFIGSFDASTSIANFIPGTLLPNGWLPDAAPQWANDYVIVNVRGTPAFGPPETRVLAEVGDWWICDGTTWFLLNVGSPSNLAANVAVNPPVFGESSVQDSLATAEATLVKKAGDSMTGSLNFLNQGNGLTFFSGIAIGTPATGILSITAPTLLINGDVTTSGTMNIMGLTSIANTLRIQNNNNAGKVEIHGAVAQTGEISFYTQEGTRRGYIGYGSGGVNHFAAENGYNWQFDQPIVGGLSINSGNLNINSGTVGLNNVQLQMRASNNNNNTYTQPISFTRQDGGALVWMRAYQNGYYISPQGIFELYTNNGGWGGQRVMWTDINPPSNVYFGGDVYSRGVKLSSDVNMKMDISLVDINDVTKAFAQLKPVRYRWKPPIVENSLAAPEPFSEGPHPDPQRLNWGFVAQDIESGAPDLVQTKDDTKSYDLAGVVAILTAKIKQLEARLDRVDKR
jgi:endosialidase-like protein